LNEHVLVSAVCSAKGLILSTLSYLAVRLVLARGSLCTTTAGRQRLASRLDAGFALCPAEWAFARLLLGVQTRYWLYRTHQQQAAGDFIAVDRSSKSAATRWFAIELKGAARLRLGRPGMQLARCRHAVGWVAGHTGLRVAELTEVVGDSADVVGLLRLSARLRRSCHSK
jgi:hypothetical protein